MDKDTYKSELNSNEQQIQSLCDSFFNKADNICEKAYKSKGEVEFDAESYKKKAWLKTVIGIPAGIGLIIVGGIISPISAILQPAGILWLIISIILSIVFSKTDFIDKKAKKLEVSYSEDKIKYDKLKNMINEGRSHNVF